MTERAGVAGGERLRWLLLGDAQSVHVRRLALALTAEGQEVHLACFRDPGLPVESHLLPGGSLGDARYLLALPALRRLLRTIGADVVNAHYLSSYGLLAALAGPRCLVQTTWGTDVLVTARRPLRRRLAGFALRRACLATGDSLSLLEGIRELSGATAGYQFVFGPPASAFDPDVPKERLILSPRRHEPPFHVGTVLEAWALARDRLPGYRLVVAGSGPLTSSLRSRAGERTQFVGEVPHQDLLDLFARARLVVSIPDSDATSAAVLEALASRCSVVASDIAANREWLPSSHLVPADPAPEELAERMVERAESGLSLDRRWSFERQVVGLIAAARHAHRSHFDAQASL